MVIKWETLPAVATREILGWAIVNADPSTDGLATARFYITKEMAVAWAREGEYIRHARLTILDAEGRP